MYDENANLLPKLYFRHSLRLPDYDYSQMGAYYVTICTQQRLALFGHIADAQMLENDAGLMIEQLWYQLEGKFSTVTLDAFVVMPNHVHGILFLNPGNKKYPPKLGQIIGTFKSETTYLYIQGVKRQQWMPFPSKLWQPNYYEHIIRDEKGLQKIREYIINNPAKWFFDRENPECVKPDPEPFE